MSRDLAQPGANYVKARCQGSLDTPFLTSDNQSDLEVETVVLRDGPRAAMAELSRLTKWRVTSVIESGFKFHIGCDATRTTREEAIELARQIWQRGP